MTPRLTDKTVIVTGAAAGIGRAAAEQFAAEGALVLAVDLDEDALGWTDAHPNIATMAGSVAEPDLNAAMVEWTIAEWGTLDAAFLNAGIPGFGSILDPSTATLEACLAVNLLGVVHGIQAVAPPMCKRGTGSIVVTASTSALAGDVGNWAYNTAKAGALNLVRSVAGELAPTGVRVNAVCPGPTLTRMAERQFAVQPEMHEAIRRNIPMGRWGNPNEVANAAVWLTTDDASFITGIALPVDGGVSALSRQFPSAAAH